MAITRFPVSPVPRFPGSPVPRFPGSPVPRFPGSPVPRFPVPENESTQKSKKSVSKVRGISKSSSKDTLMHEAMSQ